MPLAGLVQVTTISYGIGTVIKGMENGLTNIAAYTCIVYRREQDSLAEVAKIASHVY